MVTGMDENEQKTILIVDDSLENLTFLARMLEDKYKTVRAMNGHEALAKAAVSPAPDLILLDIMMPDIDGFEVIRQLKDDKDTRTIPVIFVSALGKTEDETRGLELGAVDYISKPFSIPVVMARFRTHLELKEFRDNLARDADERSMELDLTLAHLKKAYMELNEVHNQIR
jgi:CheY-like chemotaxis protein